MARCREAASERVAGCVIPRTTVSGSACVHCMAHNKGPNPVQGINQHLPESVRALAVQRVNKGFNARERCGTRTYHYFLPAAALDLSGDGTPCSQKVHYSRPSLSTPSASA